MANIDANISDIRSRIASAAKRSGRNADEIRIVAATKGVPAELIREAINAGIKDVGENRVQEAQSKFDLLTDLQINWHMIGHLQTNKVKSALEMFNVIQSVDSERLAAEISSKSAKDIEVFMEVNTSGEASKYGVSPKGAAALAEHISVLPRIKLKGLMTLGPNIDDDQKRRASFRLLKGIFDKLKLNLPPLELEYLSMGMSDDFEAAIEEGSNMVRIGRAIFAIEHKRGG